MTAQTALPIGAPIADACEDTPNLTTRDVLDLLRTRYASVSPGNGPRYVVASEVRNLAGFGMRGKLRTADLIVCDTWESGPVRLIGHEIKVSRSDWLRELADPSKAEAFTPHVSEWWLVVSDRKIVRDGELPEGWGLLAPAGDKLRAVVKARRNPQPSVPIGMIAALLRRVMSTEREIAERARRKPFTVGEVPRLGTFDHVPCGPDYRPIPGVEIQAPRYDLRRMGRR